MKSEFLDAAERINSELVSWRRELHQIPECGMNLPQTSSFIKKKLAEMNIPWREIPGSSVVIGLLGDESKPNCFLLRSDIDALPVREETGLPYASQNGNMHACGHDVHTAVLLGAAKLLKEKEPLLSGAVKLLFQPGEEIFIGARAAIDAGVMEGPDVGAAFAMHILPAVPVGEIAYGKLPMAAVYGFKITIRGQGGHGAFPHQCIDPINVGVHLHLALQELISRECSPMEEAALTIGSFNAGELSNIIPEAAVLQGTLRTFSRQTAERLIGRIHDMIRGVPSTYRAAASLEVISDLPAVVCDDELLKEFTGYIGALDGKIKLTDSFHMMGSEDFAFISERVPSAYFGLGMAVSDPEKRCGLHNPKLTVDESGLALGAACYAQVAFNWLEARS